MNDKQKAEPLPECPKCEAEKAIDDMSTLIRKAMLLIIESSVRPEMDALRRENTSLRRQLTRYK